jgi:hypothetical protein
MNRLNIKDLASCSDYSRGQKLLVNVIGYIC